MDLEFPIQDHFDGLPEAACNGSRTWVELCHRCKVWMRFIASHKEKLSVQKKKKITWLQYIRFLFIICHFSVVLQPDEAEQTAAAPTASRVCWSGLSVCSSESMYFETPAFIWSSNPLFKACFGVNAWEEDEDIDGTIESGQKKREGIWPLTQMNDAVCFPAEWDS